MTTILNEVPGARERPGNCPLSIVREDNGFVTIVIPSRGISPIALVLSCIVTGQLLVMLYIGLMLILAHRSVLFMTQISPGGLPVSLRHNDGWLLVALLLAQGLGFWTVGAVLRPLFLRERLILGLEWLRLERWDWGRKQEWQIARTDLRGFLIKRVPPGLDAGTLTVQARGDSFEFGEYLREADREWLASVGNALLAV